MKSLTGRRVAVRADADRASIEGALKERGAASIRWFEAKDDDEVNQLVLRGDLDCIVYQELDTLLTAIWKSDIEWSVWMSRGVVVELMEGATATDWQSQVTTVAESFQSWQNRGRSRQIISGILLSIAGLIALLVILQTVPIAR